MTTICCGRRHADPGTRHRKQALLASARREEPRPGPASPIDDLAAGASRTTRVQAPADPAESAANAELITRLHHALDSLDANLREVLVLRFFVGLQYGKAIRVLMVWLKRETETPRARKARTKLAAGTTRAD